MLPFLAVFGGAAAVELKNRITGDHDVKELRKREKELKKAVEGIQKEMKGDREQMEALRGEKARLEAERARLAEETDRLAAEKAELAETEGSLRSANLLLEQQKHQLTDQMGELSVRERANAEALAALRERLSRVFSLFAAGALDSDGLLGELDGMGVSVVRGGAGSVPELVMPNNGQPVGLSLDEGWKHQLQLVFDRPDRAVHLLHAARQQAVAGATSEFGAGNNAMALTLGAQTSRGSFPTLRGSASDNAHASGTPRMLGSGRFAAQLALPEGNKENVASPALAAAASSLQRAASPEAHKQPVMLMTAASPPASRQQAMVWGEQPGSKQRGKAQAGSVAVPKLSLAATRADVAERSQTAQQKQQRGGKAEASRGVLSSMLPSSMRAESEEGMAVPAQGSSKQLVHT